MNHTVHTVFTPTNTDRPLSYEMITEEHEVAALEALHSPAPLTSTVSHICSETSTSDHVIGSPFNTLFMNSRCLDFRAFTYSVKSRDSKMVGDLTRAQAYASTAKYLNIWALILGIIMAILLIIIPVLILQVCGQIKRHHPGRELCPHSDSIRVANDPFGSQVTSVVASIALRQDSRVTSDGSESTTRVLEDSLGGVRALSPCKRISFHSPHGMDGRRL
nr:interferon-induced transmembrane protein 3-like [Saimiri boliviensis boliviensis]